MTANKEDQSLSLESIDNSSFQAQPPAGLRELNCQQRLTLEPYLEILIAWGHFDYDTAKKMNTKQREAYLSLLPMIHQHYILPAQALKLDTAQTTIILNCTKLLINYSKRFSIRLSLSDHQIKIILGLSELLTKQLVTFEFLLQLNNQQYMQILSNKTALLNSEISIARVLAQGALTSQREYTNNNNNSLFSYSVATMDNVNSAENPKPTQLKQ